MRTALGGVGEHPEGKADPDRRDHQRQEEDHPEEGAPTDRLGADDRQSQPDQELHRTADDDIEKGHPEGAELGAAEQRRPRQQREAKQQRLR